MRRAVVMKMGFGMIVACSLALCGLSPAQAAVPGLINFQGHLTDDTGSPVVDGSYSMAFAIYDVELFGTARWSESHSSVSVIDGIYNVQLGAVIPLASSVFEGGVAWLEVVVDGETLSPRQRITATAFALKAEDADALIGNTLADLDARYVQEGEAGAVNSTMIADGTIGAADLGANSVGASEIGSSAVGTSEVADNSLTAADLAADSVGQSELAPNSVGSAEVIDNSLTASDLAAGSVGASEIAANAVGASEIAAGAVASSEVLDNSLTAADLAAGSVGSSEIADGTVTAADLADQYVNETGDTMSGQLSISKGGLGLYIDANPLASNVYGLQLDVDQSSANNYYTYGFYNLVNSSASSSGLYGNYTAAQKDAGTGTVYGNYQRSRHYGTDGSTYGYYSLAYGSDIGNVYGNYAYSSKLSTDTGGYAYGGYFAGDNDSSNAGYGLYATSYGSSGTNYGLYATAYNGTTNYGGYFTTTVDDGIPVVGLQSSTYTVSDWTSWAPGGLFGGRNGVVGFTEAANGYGAVGEATGDSTRGVYGVAYGASVYGGYFYGSGTSAIGVYAYGTLYAADFNGNVRIRSGSTTVMELGAGLDYAEGFDVSDTTKPDPGSVLIIDPENPGQLTLSTTAYDTKVAGIVAGANDLGSGVRLGGDQFDNDVALAGRVYCNVDATQSAIRTGDLLTTSDLPGYAMKAGDYARAQGAILGKAMQDLAQGQTGKILVLVTLQ